MLAVMTPGSETMTGRLRAVWVALLLVWTSIPVASPVRAQFGGVDLIGTQFGWKGWKGTNEPLPAGTDWRTLEHDVLEWSSLRMPVGLDNFSIGLNRTLRDMRGRYSQLFLRRTFVVGSGQKLDDVRLEGYVGGGCVIWVNGQEVVRMLAPADPIALTDVARAPSDIEWGSISAEVPASWLKPGTNLVAVRLLNRALDSDELFLSLGVFGYLDQDPPLVERVVPEVDSFVNSLRQVELVFSEGVAGVEAADLLVNGLSATNVTEVSEGDFVFDLPALNAGPVSVRLRPDHGITDRSSSSNALKTPPAWGFQLDPNARLEQVRVTEFLADNEKGLRDEDGSREDWLEVRNFGRDAISLKGWGLGSDPRGTGRWIFPDRVLAGGGYLTVFASGKNRTNGVGTLHTGFKIPKGGGSLLLFKPDGTVAGGFTNYPVQTADKSYGEVPGITGAAGFFVTPTPGGKNSEGGAGFSSEIEFSETSRTFEGSMGLVLATADPGAEIRYTTNQAEPTLTSAKYTGPMVLKGMSIIRARAFTPGLLPGPVRTEAFFAVSPNLGAFTSTLPVVVINDFDGGRPPLGTRIPAYIQVFEPGKDGVTRLQDAPALTSRAAIASRGSSTSGNPKVNLRVEFQDEVDEDRKLSFAGLPADGDWVLYGPSNFDPALINNAFAHQLSRDIGRYSPRTRFVEVYLVTRGSAPLENASYMGVYILEERIELGKDRVDIDRVAPGATVPPEVTGGYLFKIDRSGGDDGFIWTGQQQVLVLEPQGSELTASQQSWLQDHFGKFEGALYGPEYRDPVKGYRPYIDVPSWIDHHLLNVLMFNVDALRLSAYFHKPKDGPIAFGPVWDFDRALRSTDGRDLDPKVWRSRFQDLGTDFFNYTWWGQLFTDPDFFQEYIDRYEELRREAFSIPSLHRLVDFEVGQVIEAQPREARRWGNRARGGYAKEILDIKGWLSNRVTFIDGQFVRPPAPMPEYLVRALRLSFTPTNGATTYYTLDGTDPRARGGQVAPGAQVWRGSMTFGTNALLTMRTFFPNHRGLTGPNNPPIRSLWSGIVRLPVEVVRPPVQLTEVHFNPAPANGVVEEQELEFVELANTSAFEFDLSGFQLAGGIQFQCPTGAVSRIPAGGRVVIAKNPVLLRARHPGLGPVFGPYEGQLANAGDVIELRGRYGEPVQRLEYDDAWSDDADGNGYSLVPVYEGAPDLVLVSRDGWRRSAFRGGSPGALDPLSIPDMAPSVIPAADGIRLRFIGALGRSYSIWSTEDPTQPNSWRKLGSIAAPVGTGPVEWLDPDAVGARFYRVTTQ